MTINEKLPRLRFCCCCVDLRTGAIILGLLALFSAIMSWSRYFAIIFSSKNTNARLSEGKNNQLYITKQ